MPCSATIGYTQSYHSTKSAPIAVRHVTRPQPHIPFIRISASLDDQSSRVGAAAVTAVGSARNPVCFQTFAAPEPGFVGFISLVIVDNKYRIRGVQTPLSVGFLPPLLSRLILHEHSARIEVDVLPTSLCHLYLGDRYNHSLIPGVLPPRLTYLHVGDGFSQTLYAGNLPTSLIHLYFGQAFNHPIDVNVLPLTLIHLEFGGRFQQTIAESVLPSSLLHRPFSFSFCINKH